MKGKQVISTVKYVAGMRPVFLLSEIASYLDEPLTVRQIYAEIEPHLHELGLLAKKTDADFMITRMPKVLSYTLNTHEEEKISNYLADSTFPSVLGEAIEQYISKKTGKDWNDPVVLDRLRHAIVAQKDDYWKPTARRSLQYTKGYSVLGYLAYHFPVYFMQARHLLALLARDGLLKNRMTILDLGTGPGVFPLAIADFWKQLDTAQAVIYSVEKSKEHIEAYITLTRQVVGTENRVMIESPKEADIVSPDKTLLSEPVDLLICSNVLNELVGLPLAERADIMMRYADQLAPDGTILIIEPAEEASSTGLRVLSLALKKRGLSIYAPCTFVWGTNCTPDRCWSFITAPSIRPTRIMNTLAACDEPFRYVNTDIKYSYVIIRKYGKTRETCGIPRSSNAIRLSKIHLNQGRQVTVFAAKMSEDLGEKETHLYRLCDGSAMKPVYAVLPAFHITPENRELGIAPYGAVLELRNVLVRYNTGHDAYNLLVSRNSQVQNIHCL